MSSIVVYVYEYAYRLMTHSVYVYLVQRYY